MDVNHCLDEIDWELAEKHWNGALSLLDDYFFWRRAFPDVQPTGDKDDDWARQAQRIARDALHAEGSA